MQHILETHGFTRCGNIIMPENKEIENVRVAYQRHGHPLDLAEHERAAKRLIAV